MTGSCDSPECDGRKEVVTPSGYVCEECAREEYAALKEAEA